jgi:hypothetical protein
MCFLKEPYTNINKLCNIINNERPSQMMKNQSTYSSPNLIQYGRHITKNNIMDYKSQLNANKNKISSPEFEEISLFANYIVGVNIAHVAYLRDVMPYLPSEIWLLIGSMMGSQFKKSTSVVIEGHTNVYIEYNMANVFCNNYKSLHNQYITYKNTITGMRTTYSIAKFVN